MVSRFKNSTQSFKLSFKGFGARAGGGSGFSESTESIKKICDLQDNSFSQFISTQESVSIGSLLASYMVQCAGVAADSNKETIFGTTKVNEDDGGFVVDINYIQGETPLTFVLKRVSNPNGLKCFSDSENTTPAVGAIKLTGNTSNSFHCLKEAGATEIGTFVFEADIGSGSIRTKNVSFRANSRDAQRELENRLESIVFDVEKRFDQKLSMIDGLKVIDSGSYSGSARVTEHSFNLNEDGILFVSGFGRGNRKGSQQGAGIYTDIFINGTRCARDMAFEGQSSNISFYSAASCVVRLSKGAHNLKFSRTDLKTTGGTFTKMEWHVLRIRP